MSAGGYHHGKIIRKYRERRGLTQQELAERWPRSRGGAGVDWRYVQAIEYGKKRIADPGTLRRLCELLEIPPWEFGLSSYDPFNPQAALPSKNYLFEETLAVAEALLRQTLAMRRLAPLPEIEQQVQRLGRFLETCRSELPPPLRQERRLQILAIQYQSLVGLMHYEHRRYDRARGTFQEMLTAARQVRDPVLTAHALQKLGVELKRIGRFTEAISALEEARDLSLKISKPLAAFTSAYLSQMYAIAGDALRFERTIEQAIALAEPLKGAYGNGSDFVFHKLSGIFLLRSRGYLYTNQPQKVLERYEELRRQISLDRNLWLDYRLHLYRAQALLRLREVEACIEEARAFLQAVAGWQSPHRLTKGSELLSEIERAGYGDLAIVRAFRQELQEHLQQARNETPQ
ncbi:helix-turn-helix domain-containing protein [Thermogemmatispora onikobensis]|uniref:helix-turn-helix domain-containing protein n=1 Tax=Thermogemmatispora onikobensis TaxID=732234 RepID=UPI000853BD85|nr:helix-turn-helix transcriptional regulator [Thermogemmatispora onikobensis]